MHPEFAQHGSFEHLKLGRKPARRDARTLEFAKYINLAELPAVPTAIDLTAVVPSWPMYDNNQLGDCTCAAAGHMVQAWSAAIGSKTTPADSDVDLLYWETGDPPSTSGQAGGATDDGRDELSVLNYWRQTGLGADKIGAYVAVDPSNLADLRAGIYLFGGVYTGISLPITAQGQAEWDVVGDGKTGNSAPGSWGGHAVPYEAFDANAGTFTVVTWGATLKLTTAFHLAYTDEAYCIISSDFLTRAGESPEGFDMAALQADLAAI
jgi:hypothetical protein